MRIDRRLAAALAAGVVVVGAAGAYAGSLSIFAPQSLGAGSVATQASCATTLNVAPGAATFDTATQLFSYSTLTVSGDLSACSYVDASATVFNNSTGASLSGTTAHEVTSGEASGGSFNLSLTTPINAGLSASTFKYAVVLESSETGGAVTGIAATTGFQSLDVTWVAPSDDGGAPVTGYKVEYAVDSSGSPGAYTTYINKTPSPATAQTVYGLTPGSHYWFRITPWNGYGLSSHSAATLVAPTPYGTPGAPTSVAGATPSSGPAGELDASWVAPASDGYKALTGYRIQYSQACFNGSYYICSSWNTFQSDTGTTATTATITGLAPGAYYFVRVTALNPVAGSPGTSTTEAQASV